MSTQRLDRVVAALRERRLAGLALMPDANLTYLSSLGFHKGKRLTLALIPADGARPCFVLPALEQSKCEAGSLVAMRYFPWSDADGPAAALEAAVAAAFPEGLGGRELAVEFTSLRVMELRAIEAAIPSLRVADATAMMADLRMVKDEQELAAIEQAVRIVEVALRRTVEQIRAGMTERELSRICADAIVAAGADGESFENIVASGPNAANPHHSNSDRAFQPGDLIIIDCGARYGGYISDITRTVALGEPSDEARRIYELVLGANEAGRRACRPEATGAEIDAAARSVIEAGGYGQSFIHRTGHGYGLEAHELPNIVAGSDEPLAPGTTFTVEPGIYVPGLTGVRIEDDMVITADGARSLTSFPRELMIIPA
ncbi:MAG TPA: Xaa-Pro peptidase family protein [Chloroflexaceae bacterium]|nr:Xaa-Pro peptidase family protein [Chloroflexaceae bacterium]